MTKNVLLLIALSRLIFAQNVENHGTLMTVMHGDLNSHFNLQQIQDQQNIYGLGAVAGLKGEITVLNSKPYITYVKEGQVFMDSSFNHNAALFFHSKVNNWVTDSIRSAIDIAGLGKIISEKRRKTEGALPLLINANVQSLNWHVVDWPKGDTVHTHQKHKKSGLHGTINNQQVTIVGFYSTHHQGILTHMNSNMHLHFVTDDKKLAGHVDDFVIKKAVLKMAYGKE